MWDTQHDEVPPPQDLIAVYERLDQALRQSHLSRTELLRRLGVTMPHRTAYNWWSSRRPKILQFLPMAAAVLQVHEVWLRTGEGSASGAIAVVGRLGADQSGGRIERAPIAAGSHALPDKPTALRVDVTAWIPFAAPGDLVVIDPAGAVDIAQGSPAGPSELHGRIVLVEAAQEGWFLARCTVVAGISRGFLLAPIDPRHPTPLPLSEAVTRLIPVVGVLQAAAGA